MKPRSIAIAAVLLAAPLTQAAPVDQAALVAAGEELAAHGAPNVPPCFTCHGAQGLGDGGHFPRIAGRPAQFVVDRVHAFQARAREKTPAPGTMTAVSAQLTDRQIDAAAAYLSQLDAQGARQLAPDNPGAIAPANLPTVLDAAAQPSRVRDVATPDPILDSEWGPGDQDLAVSFLHFNLRGR